jgi:hypothetical protein
MSTAIINATLSNGNVLPLRATATKKGHPYWTVQNPKTHKAPSRYGMKVAGKLIGDALPTEVEINGTTLVFAHDVNQDGKPRAYATGPVGDVDGEPRQCAIGITAQPDGNYVITTARVTRTGGGGGGTVDTL